LVAATVPFTDTFTDNQIRDFIRGGDLGDLSVDLSVDLPLELDEFSFPADLMPTCVDPATVLPGLGAPIVDPYDMAFAAPPSGDLLLMLEKMTPDERATKVEALKGMSGDGIEKENNAARNYFMLNSLGLSDAEKETLWGGAVAPPAVKRKAPAKEKRRSKKARKEVEVEESEGEEEEASENEPETPTPHENATNQRQKPTGNTAAKGKGTAAAVGWERKALSELESKDYGEKWKALVSLWWKREEGAGFKGTVSKPFKRRRRSAGIGADDMNHRNRQLRQRNVPRRSPTGWGEREIIHPQLRMRRILERDSGGGGWTLTPSGVHKNDQ
jgi:hypothetical protein